MQPSFYISETFVTTAANQEVGLPIPNRCRITRLTIVGPSTFTAGVFNRHLTSATKDIAVIRAGDGGKLDVITKSPLPLYVGDTVTLASTGVVGYHTPAKVLAKLADNRFVLDINHDQDVVTGTAALTLPSGDFPLYRVMGDLSGTSNVALAADLVGVPFDSYEPRPTVDPQVLFGRPLVLRLSEASTYRVSIVMIPAHPV